jgi:two-component system, response regulator
MIVDGLSAVDILLADDNENDIELTIRAFRKHRVVNSIQIVRDGQEALEYLFCTGRYSHRTMADLPKVVLLDVKMPFVDGIEVLRRIRSDHRTHELPVVMLTSSSLDRDAIECYNLGVNSYIVKPVDFEQFHEAARVIGFYWLFLNKPRPLAETPQ